MTISPTARIYTRVSTALQSEQGFSMAAQEGKARAWCAYQGLSEVLLYPEAAVSGRRNDRPQLEALLSDLQSGDTVVVYALSRLGRGGAVQMLGIVHRIRERGARLVSLTEQIDTESSTGRLMLTILAALAELEVELTRERTEFGRLQAASQGVYPHSPDSLPLGWTTREGRIVEDAGHADTVRLIFAQGQASYLSTASMLTALSVPSGRGGTWSVQQVRRAVLFEGYHTGVLRYRSGVLPGQPDAWIDIPAPKLVSREVWQAAQRTASTNHRHSKPDRFPLTGHLLCTCGARLYGRTRTLASTPATHTRLDAYRCMPNGRGTATCSSNGGLTRLWLDAEAIHRSARAALTRYLLDPSDPARLQAELPGGTPDLNAQERLEVERRMAALIDLHLDGLIDRAGYEVRYAALSAQKRTLSAPVARAPAAPVRDLSPLALVVASATNAELAEMLDALGVQFAMNADGTVRVLHVQDGREGQINE